jgi:hypothetical protein
MTQKEISKTQVRISEIWAEMEDVITGTGISSLIEELVELEIELSKEENM